MIQTVAPVQERIDYFESVSFADSSLSSKPRSRSSVSAGVVSPKLRIGDQEAERPPGLEIKNIRNFDF